MNGKKLISLATIGCFLFSFVFAPGAQALVEMKRGAGDFKQILNDFTIPPMIGRITKGEYFGSQKVLLNIQDLHCHPEVQRNISRILALLDDKYNIGNVYIEGAWGNINTSWLAGIQDRELKKEIIETLLDQGKLTGSEYYSITRNRPDMLKGVEDEAPYKENIVRLGKILEKKSYFEEKTKELKRDLDLMQTRYFNSKNKRFNRIFLSHKNEKLSTEKYYKLLCKYVDKINSNPGDYNSLFAINMEKYRDITGYLALAEKGKRLQYKRVSRQLQEFVSVLKQKLPYNAYNFLLQKTDNFSKLDELYVYLSKIAREWDLNLTTNYPDLNEFFEYIQKGQEVNPLLLVKEEKRLVEEIRIGLSSDISELEVSFLIDFFGYFEDYLNNRLSAEDYQYFGERIDEFQNIWSKYAFRNRLPGLADDFKLLNDFYEVNADRNRYFIKNVLGNFSNPTVCRPEKGLDENITKTVASLDTVDEVIIVVTGGFHTEGLEKLLKERKISYLQVTPNVTEDTKKSNEIYMQLAKYQAKILDTESRKQSSGSKETEIKLSAAFTRDFFPAPLPRPDALALWVLSSMPQDTALYETVRSLALKKLAAINTGDRRPLAVALGDLARINPDITTAVNGGTIEIRVGARKFEVKNVDGELTLSDRSSADVLTRVPAAGSTLAEELASVRRALETAIETPLDLTNLLNLPAVARDVLVQAEIIAAQNGVPAATGDGLIYEIEQGQSRQNLGGVPVEIVALLNEFTQKLLLERQRREEALNKAAHQNKILQIVRAIDFLRELAIEAAPLWIGRAAARPDEGLHPDALLLSMGDAEMTRKITEVMRKYDADWWNSTDPAVIARYQLNEKDLLVPWLVFQNAVETELGREVTTAEFTDREKLLRELEKKKGPAGQAGTLTLERSRMLSYFLTRLGIRFAPVLAVAMAIEERFIAPFSELGEFSSLLSSYLIDREEYVRAAAAFALMHGYQKGTVQYESALSGMGMIMRTALQVRDSWLGRLFPFSKYVALIVSHSFYNFTSGTGTKAGSPLTADGKQVRLINWSPADNWRIEIHGAAYKEEALTVGKLQEAGMLPKYVVEVEGARVYFSGPYEYEHGRIAIVGYMQEGERLVARTFYRSNSQGIWRYLPSYLPGWYDKGYGEDSLTLPFALQKAISSIVERQSLQKVPNSKLVFFGTARHLMNNRPDITYYGDESLAHPTKIEGIMNGSDGRKLKPEEIHIANSGDRPDFGNTVDTFKMQTSLYGEITVEVYASRNGNYNYMFARDNSGRAWIVSIEDRSGLSSMGIRQRWVRAGDLTTPAFEYQKQSDGYGAAYHQEHTQYVDMFANYLSKIGIIREYLAAKRAQQAPARQEARGPEAVPPLKIGGNRNEDSKNSPFIGNVVWIGAGSYLYRVRVDEGGVKFQRHDSNRNPLGKEYDFGFDQDFAVGRTAGDYQINDPKLSGRHFSVRISHDPSGYFRLLLADRGSLNGTYLYEFSTPTEREISNSAAREAAKEAARLLMEINQMLFSGLKLKGTAEVKATLDKLETQLNSIQEFNGRFFELLGDRDLDPLFRDAETRLRRHRRANDIEVRVMAAARAAHRPYLDPSNFHDNRNFGDTNPRLIGHVTNYEALVQIIFNSAGLLRPSSALDLYFDREGGQAGRVREQYKPGLVSLVFDRAVLEDPRYGNVRFAPGGAEIHTSDSVPLRYLTKLSKRHVLATLLNIAEAGVDLEGYGVLKMDERMRLFATKALGYNGWDQMIDDLFPTLALERSEPNGFIKLEPLRPRSIQYSGPIELLLGNKGLWIFSYADLPESIKAGGFLNPEVAYFIVDLNDPGLNRRDQKGFKGLRNKGSGEKVIIGNDERIAGRFDFALPGVMNKTMDPSHLLIQAEGNTITLTDQNSRYGTRYRIAQDTRLHQGVLTAILPANRNWVRQWAQRLSAFLPASVTAGILAVAIGIGESFPSIMTPDAFIKAHEKPEGAKAVVAATKTAGVVSLGAGLLLAASMLTGILPVTVVSLLGTAAAMASIVLGTNIVKHAIIDYHFMRSTDLVEKIQMFGTSPVKIENGRVHVELIVRTDIKDLKELSLNVKDLRNTGMKVNVGGEISTVWAGYQEKKFFLYIEGLAGYEEDVAEQMNKIFSGNSKMGGNKLVTRRMVDLLNENPEVSLKDIDFNAPPIVFDYRSNGKRIVYKNGIMYASAGWFRKTGRGELSKEQAVTTIGGLMTISDAEARPLISVLGELMTIRNAEAVAVPQNILLNLDDVQDTDSFLEAVAVVGAAGIGQIIVPPAAFEKLSDSQVTRLAELARQAGVKVYLDLRTSVSRDYAALGFPDYIAEGEGATLVVYDSLTENMASGEIIKFNSSAELSSRISQSGAVCKIVSASDLGNLMRGGERSIVDRVELVDALKRIALSFYRQPDKEYVKRVAYAWDREQLPELREDDILRLINAIENNARIDDIIAAMGLGEEPHAVAMYLEKLAGEVKEPAALQREFLKGITARTLAKMRLNEVHKENGLADGDLELVLGEKLYQQKHANITLTEKEKEKIQAEVHAFISTGKVTAEVYAQLHIEVFKKKNDPQSANLLIELIAQLGEPRILQMRRDMKEIFNQQSVKEITSAA